MSHFFRCIIIYIGFDNMTRKQSRNHEQQFQPQSLQQPGPPAYNQQQVYYGQPQVGYGQQGYAGAHGQVVVSLYREYYVRVIVHLILSDVLKKWLHGKADKCKPILLIIQYF